MGIFLNYERLFVCYFLCGLFNHKFQHCPVRIVDCHFLRIERQTDEPMVLSAHTHVDTSLQNLMFDYFIVIFPQPFTSVIATHDHDDADPDEHDDDADESPARQTVERRPRSYSGWGSFARGTDRGRGGLTRTGTSFSEAVHGSPSYSHVVPSRPTTCLCQCGKTTYIVLSDS